MEAVLKETEMNRGKGRKEKVSQKNVIYNSYISNYGAHPKTSGKLTSASRFENWLYSAFCKPDNDAESEESLQIFFDE